MSKFDYLDLNGRALQLFLIVLEEGSVTKAAERLNVSQSAVSHMLDKLRQITGDPLFVRSGRGIVATHQAELLAEKMRPLLSSLQQLSFTTDFDPAKLEGVVTIGAAALQREVLLPPLASILRKEAPNLDLKVINSGVFGGDLLRKNRCDVLITPSSPDGTEFIQRKLFEDRWVCFYDPSTPAPTTLDQYLARRHAKVVFSEDERSMIDVLLHDMGKKRRIALRVESFSALASLMRGTDLVIALPQFSGNSFMSGFASCSLPFHLAPLKFYMSWHLGKNTSPYHQWLRARLVEIAAKLK